MVFRTLLPIVLHVSVLIFFFPLHQLFSAKVANLQAHNVRHRETLWACRSHYSPSVRTLEFVLIGTTSSYARVLSFQKPTREYLTWHYIFRVPPHNEFPLPFSLKNLLFGCWIFKRNTLVWIMHAGERLLIYLACLCNTQIAYITTANTATVAVYTSCWSCESNNSCVGFKNNCPVILFSTVTTTDTVCG